MVGHLIRSKFKPQKEYLHPLRDVCVQYERNPHMGFRDLLQKRNADRRRDIWGDAITPAPTSSGANKKYD